jgi:hypothetical protein
MSQIANFKGWNVADTFVVQPASALITADSHNVHGRTYVWVLPLATGALVGKTFGGVDLSVTFAAKDLNIFFPIPFTQVTSFAGGAGNLIAGFPAL